MKGGYDHTALGVGGQQTGQEQSGKEKTGARTGRQISGRIQINHNGVFSVQFHFQRAGCLAHR
jgi:hypothetical protein